MNRNKKSAEVQMKDEVIRRTLEQMGLEESDETYEILYNALWKSVFVGETKKIN